MELIGWYGVIAILGAYRMVNFSLIGLKHPVYSFLNLTGSLGLIFDAWHQKNYQPVVLNIIWSVIALLSLLRIFV